MTLKHIKAKLEKKLNNGTLPIGKSTLDIPEIDTLFQSALNTKKIDLNGVLSINLDQSRVTFSGKTKLFNIPDLNVDVTIAEDGDRTRFSFTADLVSNWKFNPSNPQPPAHLKGKNEFADKRLLEPLFNQLTTEKPAFVFATHAHHHDGFNVQVAKGLNFVWIINDSDSQNINSFAAPLQVKDNKLLFAVDLPLDIRFGKISFDRIHMDLTSRLSAELPPSDSALSLSGVLTAGDLSLDVVGRLESTDLNMVLTGKFIDLSVNGFTALKDLTGIKNLSSLLPQGLKRASGLALREIKFGFNPMLGTVSAVGLILGSTHTWALWPGLFNVKDIQFLTEIEYPLDDARRNVNIVIRGWLKLAGGDVIVTAVMPDFTAYGELEAGHTINLRELLQEFAPAAANGPQLDIDKLGVRISPINNAYSIGARIKSDWQLDLGVTELIVRQLGFNFSSTRGEIAGTLEGILGLAGSDFLIHATIPDFKISAALASGESLSLKSLFEELLSGQHSFLGNLPSLTITDPEFSITPTSGEFAFKGQCQDQWDFSLGITTLSLTNVQMGIQQQISANKKQLTAHIAGQFNLDSTVFAAKIEKYGDSDDWKFSGQMKQTQTVDMVGVLCHFLPTGFSLPDQISGIKIKEVSMAMDLGSTAFSLMATTASRISFAGLGSVKATGVKFNLNKRAPNASKYDWYVQVQGGLKLANGLELQGALEYYDNEQGTGFAFKPETHSPLTVSLPLPQYKGKDVSLGLTFGPLAIQGKNTSLRFNAGLTVSVLNIPQFFDNIIPDDITAAFEADQDSFRLILDRVFEGAELQVPPVPVSATQEIELGKMRLDLTDIKLLLGDKVEVKGKLGVGIPSQLNNVFGTKTNGQARMDVFNTYDPSQPTASLINFHLGAGSNGISFTLLDSPFKIITFATVDGKTWCDCDFGEYGAVRFMLPTLSLETSSSSFKGAGAAQVVRPLKVPLSLIKNFLKENGQSDMAEALPQALTMKEVRLLDRNNRININKLVGHVEAMGGGAFVLPVELKNTLKILEDKFDRLPDRLKQYFNIVIPDGFSFDIAITPDGGATINIQIDGQPLKFLFASPQMPMLFGVEFRGFSFGEVLSGQLFLVKADFSLDYFDIYQLAAAFLPTDQLKYLADSRSLQNTIIVRNLTMFIFYHSQVPIPIPLFYDELGLEYKGIEDCEFQTHVRFPQPRLDPMEMIKLLGELQKFFADKNFLLDTSKPLKNIDPTFTLGANYIHLPKYLGGQLLGKKTNIGSISLYLVMAHLLNGIKTFSLNRLIRAVPVIHRIGTQKIEFLSIPYTIQWLVTTPEEFNQGAYRKLNLTPTQRNGVFKILPGQPTANQEGLALFLNGTGKIANSIASRATFALFGSGHAMAARFEIDADLADKLVYCRFNGTVKINSKEATPFQLTGINELKMLNSPIMTGTIGYDAKGLTMTGQMNLFPANAVINVIGTMHGTLRKDAFNLSGNVQFQIAQHFTLSGARAQITHKKMTVSGTYMNQTIILAAQQIAKGVRFTAGLSAIKAGSVFQITGPSAKGGPNLTLDTYLSKSPVITLTGTVRLLQGQNRTTITLTPTGYQFQVTVKLFKAYMALLKVKTPSNLLKTDAIAITANLQNDFIKFLQSNVGKGLKSISDVARGQVNQAQKQIDQAQKAVNKVVQQIQQKMKQVENEIKTKERQAQQQVNNAQKSANKLKSKLSDTQKQVNKIKDQALKAKNNAQNQVDGLNQDIKKANDRIKSLRQRLSKCKPFELTKKAQIAAQIAAKETEKAGLITTRNGANLTLKTAKTALLQATNAANQAIKVVNNELSKANKTLDQAKQKLSDARKLFNTINRDSRVIAVKNIKKSKDTLLNQAKAKLNQINSANKKSLNMADYILREGVNRMFAVQSAAFSGTLDVIHAGKVSMTVKYNLMNGPKRSLKVSFDFKKPSNSINTIVQQLK